ncbi:MAG: hypothetical protein HW402_1055 [Dehalococcoidales bacterium]|nr:hypothetical protein [Dehalococcoidales bacterium]
MRLFINLFSYPLPLLQALYQKGVLPCHPERNEGYRGGGAYWFTASPTLRFFVALLLRMTFDTSHYYKEGE